MTAPAWWAEANEPPGRRSRSPEVGPTHLGGASSLQGWYGKSILAAFVVLGALAGWSRLSGIGAGLWHDEVYSIVHYTNPGPSAILGGPYVPNDHALFNLLNWATTHLLGHGDAVFRLWSTLPALAALLIAGVWVCRRMGPWTGVLATVLLVSSPLQLALARQARGYGLAFLAQALLLVAGDRAARSPSRRSWGWLGGAAIIGIWTLPVFVLSFLGSVGALAPNRNRRRALGLVVLTVGFASLAFYSGVLSDILNSSSQQFGNRLPWHGFVSGPVDQLGTPTARLLILSRAWIDGDAILSTPPGLILIRIALGVLALLGAAALWRRRDRDLALLLAMPILFTYVVLTVGRLYVEPRFGSYLLVPYMILVSVGAARLIDALRVAGTARRAAIGLAVLVSAFASFRLMRHAQWENEAPIENFKGAAAVVQRTGVGSVLTNDTRFTGLPYYLGAIHEKFMPTAGLVRQFCSARPPLVFVDAPFDATEPSTACLVRRHATVVRLPQQERGGHIDVWVLH